MTCSVVGRSVVSRRRLLASAGLLGVGALMAACAPAAAPTNAPAKPAAEATKPPAAPMQAPATATTAPTKPGPEGTAAATKPVAPAGAAAGAKPDVVTLTINVGAAGIKDEAITGRPGAGKFGNWYEVQVFDTHLQKFTEQNPKIKVNVDWFPGRPFDEKVLAKKAAGQLGDIVHGLGLALDMATKNEIYRPLDDLVKGATFDLKQYYPNTIDALRLDARTARRGAGAPLMALPRTAGPGEVVLFYNAELLDKKGVKPPSPDMPLNDLVQSAAALTERKQGATVADVYGWLINPFGSVSVSWLRFFGGELMDKEGKKALLNAPEVKAAAQFIYDGIYKQGVSPRPDQETSLGGYKNLFLQQKLAMYRLAPWGVLATSDMPLKGEKGYFEWKPALMPKGPGGQLGTILDVAHIGVAPSSKFPEEAFQVLGWVTNKDAAVLQCFAAAMCGPRSDALEDAEVKNRPLLTLVNPITATARLPNYAANGRDSEAVAAANTEWSKLVNDQVKPDNAFFDNLTKVVQDVLDKPPA